MRTTLVLLAILLLAGCISSRPANQTRLIPITRLKSLQGSYKNSGESKDTSQPHYLSNVLWPDLPHATHASIDTVAVKITDHNEILIQAFNKDGLVKEQKFIAGRDFTLKRGQIHLKHKTALSLAYPADNPFIGTIHEKSILGVDAMGNGTLRTKSTIVGTAYLIIPLAGSLEEEVQFRRIDGDN